MTPPSRSRYAGHRFPAEITSHAVWLYFRFPLGLRMVEEMLAARGIIVSHESARPQAYQSCERVCPVAPRHLRKPGAADHRMRQRPGRTRLSG